MKNFAKAGINKWRVRKGRFGSTDEMGNYGAFKIPLDYDGNRIAWVIAADGEDTGWEHVSVHISFRNKKGKIVEQTPTWDDMRRIKDLFWSEDETVVQFHPSHEQYINMHRFTLHLWKPETIEIPMPDSLLVGFKLSQLKKHLENTIEP